MKAMVLRKVLNLETNNAPLQLVDMKEPVPGEKEILIRVSRCGVCHTELDEIEGRTPPLTLPHYFGPSDRREGGKNRERGKEVQRGRQDRYSLDTLCMQGM